MDNLMMVEINSSEDWVVMDFTFPTKAVEADEWEDGFFSAAAAANPALRGTAAGEQGEEEGGKAGGGAVSGAFVGWSCACGFGRGS